MFECDMIVFHFEPLAYVRISHSVGSYHGEYPVTTRGDVTDFELVRESSWSPPSSEKLWGRPSSVYFWSRKWKGARCSEVGRWHEKNTKLWNRKMFYDKCITISIIVGTSSSFKIECPLLDPARCTITTESRIICTASLMKAKSLDEVFFIRDFRYFLGSVLREREECIWIAEILWVSIRDESIVSCDSHRMDFFCISREVSSSFYFFMSFLDVRKSEHRFLENSLCLRMIYDKDFPIIIVDSLFYQENKIRIVLCGFEGWAED